jgi:hypothetical protein
MILERLENYMDNSIRIAKIIRMATVAPLMALALLSAMYLFYPLCFEGLHNYIFAIIFLVVFPIIAYPIQPLIPKFKNKGREGQRDLAILMAIVGYIVSIIYAFIMRAPKMVWLIFLTYFISGIGIVIFNKLVKIRASGHACGVSGSVCLIIYLTGLPGLVGLALLALVFWASLKTKRHTLSQLMFGSIISAISFLISALIINIT